MRVLTFPSRMNSFNMIERSICESFKVNSFEDFDQFNSWGLAIALFTMKIHGMTGRQIAEILGFKEVVVRVHINSGRELYEKSQHIRKTVDKISELIKN